MTQNQPDFGKIIDKSDAAKALSLQVDRIRDDLPVQQVSTGLDAIIIPLKSLIDMAACKVDYTAMDDFHKKWRKCNLLAFADDGKEIRARVLMDDPGYREDPATWSANGDLAAYLLHYGCFSSSEVNYVVRQGIELGRPSTIFVTASKDNEKYSIRVGGEVQPVAEGEWL